MTADAYEQRIRRLAKACRWKPEKSRRDGTYRLSHMDSSRVLRAKGSDYGLKLRQIDQWLQENEENAAPREIHPLAAELQAAIEESPHTEIKDWLVLSGSNDPFALDTPANHVAGLWLKKVLDDNGITYIHDRGVFYVLVSTDGLERPDKTPFTNTEANWNWLLRVINAARWLGHVSFERISDRKNAPGVFRIRTAALPEPSVATDTEFYLPTADDLQPKALLDGFTHRQINGELVPVTRQPYRIAMMGEKSSLDTVLRPISDKYATDLVLFTGTASNTRIWEMAREADKDGRPLVVLYFADCDPWGWAMPSDVSRKLQALQVEWFPTLRYQVHRVALTPEQVLNSDPPLPQSPIEKKGKTRKQIRVQEELRRKWIEAMGVEQTEIDAIATLRPDLLTQIAEEAIAPFYDPTLDERVADAAEEWRVAAQELIDAEIDQAALDSAIAEIEEHRDEIQAILDERVQPIIDVAEGIELPDAPDEPEPEVADDEQPEPLADSDWSFTHQTLLLQVDRKFGDADAAGVLFDTEDDDDDE